MLTIEKFKEEHVAPVLADFRQSDKDEVWASSRQTPEEALVTSIEASPSYCNTFLWDGVAVAIFGVAPHGDWGIPWLLATESIGGWGKEFLPMSKVAADEMLELYPQQSNYVDSRNEKSIKWLEYIGYTIGGTEDTCVLNGETFYRFWRYA